MTEPAPIRHPRSPTGEIPAGAPQSYADALELIEVQNRKLNAAWGEITKLKRSLATSLGEDPEDAQIVEVLTYWSKTMSPRAVIVKGDDRWNHVKRLMSSKDLKVNGRPTSPFTVVKLKGTVIGANRDLWVMDPAHRSRRSGIFRDPGRAHDYYLSACAWKRVYGASAYEILEELGTEGLAWLAERCSCGHIWLTHLHSGTAAQGGAQVCTVDGCDCGLFDVWHAKVERFKREQEQT